MLEELLKLADQTDNGERRCGECRFCSGKEHSENICIISGITVSEQHIACESFD